MFGWLEEIRKAEARRKAYESQIYELERRNKKLDDENYKYHQHFQNVRSKRECFDLAIKAGAKQDTALELAQKLHKWIFEENKNG